MGFLFGQPGPKMYTTWPNSSPWPSSTGSSFVRTLTANGHRLCYIDSGTLRHCNIVALRHLMIFYFCETLSQQKMADVLCPNQFDQIWPNWRPQRAKWFRIDKGWRLSVQESGGFVNHNRKYRMVKSVLLVWSIIRVHTGPPLKCL